MKKIWFFLLLCGLSSAWAQSPTALIKEDGISLDLPYVEVQMPSGEKKAFSLQLIANDPALPRFQMDLTTLRELDLQNPDDAVNPFPEVVLETSLGNIVLRLNREKAPISVENYLRYVNEGHYDGTIFHRVIDGFMIQGGGFTEQYQAKTTHEAIENESQNGLKNLRGTVAMARTSAPHTATAQFYINVEDNAALDYPSFDGWGYAVFGEVIEGMDVVDQIKALETGSGGPFTKDVPITQVVIQKASAR